MNAEEAIVVFTIIYFFVMGGGIYGLYGLSRRWRIVLYLFLGAAHLFIHSCYYALTFIDVNNAFTVQTMDFFTALAEQLQHGGIHEELLTPPSLTLGLLLSAFGVLILAGGAAAVWAKPRWWTWLPVCLGLILSFYIFAYPKRKKEGIGIAEQNELRLRTYEVVKGKRTEGVTDALLAETITIQMKDFRGTYENRSEAKESADRILSALRVLQPQ